MLEILNFKYFRYNKSLFEAIAILSLFMFVSLVMNIINFDVWSDSLCGNPICIWNIDQWFCCYRLMLDIRLFASYNLHKSLWN